MHKELTLRWTLGVACVTGLVLVFLFQRLDVAGAWHLASVPLHKFLINRTVRFLLNDLLAIGRSMPCFMNASTCCLPYGCRWPVHSCF
jgi:hypothetical protein